MQLRLRVVLAAALLLSTCTTPKRNSKTDNFWQAEIANSEKIRAQGSAEAALQYLFGLPAQLPPGQQATPFGEYRRLRAMATLEYNLGHWKEADQHLKQCLSISAAQKNAKRSAQVEITRVHPLLKLNRLPEAEEALEAARAYARLAKDTSLDRFILHATGLLLETSEHFEDAVAALNSSVTLFEKAQERGQAANVRIDLGWVYYQLGHFDKASDQFVAAQAEALPQDQHLCLGNLGNLAFEQRDFSKAAAYYRQAAEAARGNNPDLCARWLTNEASAWIELKEWQNAADRNQEALAIGDRLPNMFERQLAVVNRARIAAGKHDTVAALEQLRTILAGVSKKPGPTLDAYAELARIYQRSGRAAQAEAAYGAGVALIDRQRTELHDLDNKLSFAASAINLKQQYVAGLMANRNTEKAFETAEASRARMLRDNLNLPEHLSEGGTLATYRALARHTGLAYMAYWVAPEQSYLWVIAPESYGSYLLPGESELRGRIDRFQQLVQARQNAAVEGSALFRTLVQPALHQLRGIRQIVIVPDGPLYGINFETLRQGSDQAPYWIESVTLSIAPSLSLMLGEQPVRSSTSRVLLMGGAKEWNLDFPQLLSSPRELDAIAAQFPPSNQTRLTGEHATPAEYERQSPSRFRFIHFATHAAANRSAPLESAIILSQAAGRGKLTARDVLRVPVHAELVSISACRSAGAKTYAGEGLVGLAWAFLRAGAHSVVAGLWDVNDYSSPLVMGAFYGGLAKGQDAAEALRAAKLEMLKPGKYADPYFWGPFVLYRGTGSMMLTSASVK